MSDKMSDYNDGEIQDNPGIDTNSTNPNTNTNLPDEGLDKPDVNPNTNTNLHDEELYKPKPKKRKELGKRHGIPGTANLFIRHEDHQPVNMMGTYGYGGKRRKTRRGKRSRKTKKRKQKKAKQSRRRRRSKK
jgi:hypothetical protein